jgi:hypothetical protein
MEQRLAQLGFAIALEPIPNNFRRLDPRVLDDDYGPEGNYYGSNASLRKTASSHTAGRSAHTSGNATAPSSPFMQRPMKRQRLDSPLPSSRDAMPPPQKPMSRMQSVTRKIIPTLRKKLTGGRSTPAPYVDDSYGRDVQMRGNEQWGDTMNSRTTTHQYHHSESPYMSGALPVEQPPQATASHGSQLLSSIGLESDKPDFTLRASSPVRTIKQSRSHQPVQLPTEPSYIRLMDGLTHDSGIELGLKDPRQHDSGAYQYDSGQRQVKSHQEHGREDQRWDDRVPCNPGSRIHPQVPNGSSLPVSRLLEYPRDQSADVHVSRAYQEPLNPATPAPRRQQQQSHQMESVVSPFIDNYYRQTPVYSESRIAEPQDSSNRSVAYPSPRPQLVEIEPAWREPRSLNGLSFMDSPVNSRNRPILYNHDQRAAEQRPPSHHYQSRNLDSRGFITRPETGKSPFFRDSAYGPPRERPSYSRQQQVRAKPANSFPSFNRSSYSRSGQVPASMPSIVSGRSPVRTQLQWQALQRMGVRSSRHEFSSHAGSTLNNSSRDVYSSAGRRRVRR